MAITTDTTRGMKLAQALGWLSYTCRCGELVPHSLPSKYCPGSDVEGPLWSDYLSTHHGHVHWALAPGVS